MTIHILEKGNAIQYYYSSESSTRSEEEERSEAENGHADDASLLQVCSLTWEVVKYAVWQSDSRWDWLSTYLGKVIVAMKWASKPRIRLIFDAYELHTQLMADAGIGRLWWSAKKHSMPTEWGSHA